MNRCAYQQNSFVGACVSPNDVVCPKPRRIGITPTVNFYDRPSPRFLHIRNQQGQQYFDVNAGAELLDIIRTNGGSSIERSNFQLASSPPFFNGSPPVRTSNPLIQDEQFVNEKINPLPPSYEPSTPTRSCSRASFGTKPAPVRIEGFDCRRNCSISSLA